MVAFIDDDREGYGVEPICSVLPIAASTYYAHKAVQRDPTLRSARARCVVMGTHSYLRGIES
jgi:hypothetical protein